MKVLVTGVAGFIGMHCAISLLNRGDTVIGIDNLTDYYDVKLKKKRLEQIQLSVKSSTHDDNFTFYKSDIANTEELNKIFKEHQPDRVINLAAQPGVRYSLENPMSYIQTNIVGFANILECCRHHEVEHLVYASSSSVYGANTSMPYSVHDNVDHPLSLYAASKKSNELMAHTYSYLYNIPTTGLRFFTVYGSWGRPDMSPMLFANAIATGKPIDVFNYGRHQRDFTYIDDVTEGLVSVVDCVAASNPKWDTENPDPGSSSAPWRIYNIGNQEPVELMDYIQLIEKYMGKKAKMNLLPLQPGDVVSTYADVESLVTSTGYKPDTPIEKGIDSFISWYKKYNT